MTALPQLVVPARFNGPPGSGNGGYTAGRLAEHFLLGRGEQPGRPTSSASAAVTVTLREPPPLDLPLDLAAEDDGRVTAAFGGAVIATAESGDLTRVPVQPVSVGIAREAEARYAGLSAHPFPGCFVCGTDRPLVDGMRLRPGRVSDSLGSDADDRVACTWTPDESVTDADGHAAYALVWAALDCPSGWTSNLAARPMVLGRITAAVDARPLPGERCVVVARVLGTEGRKTFAASTAYDPDGRVVGRAEATWIALRPS